jgi:hypothetical protein
MASEDVLKELLEAAAKVLVDHPEEVQVHSVEGQVMTVLELRVHPEDLGTVIGRMGAWPKLSARFSARRAGSGTSASQWKLSTECHSRSDVCIWIRTLSHRLFGTITPISCG